MKLSNEQAAKLLQEIKNPPPLDLSDAQIIQHVVALTTALDVTLKILGEVWRWNPSSIPTHITIKGNEIQTSLLYELAKMDLKQYGVE